jgi:hypothetical protein
MAKVERPQQSYDLELAEKGLRRIYRIEFTDDFKPIHREHIIKIDEYIVERTPWWKKKTQKSKRSKSSKA